MIFIKFYLGEQISQMQISSILTGTREQARRDTRSQKACTDYWGVVASHQFVFKVVTAVRACDDLRVTDTESQPANRRQHLHQGLHEFADVRQQTHKCHCSGAEWDFSASDSRLLSLLRFLARRKFFSEKMWNDKWPPQRCLFSLSVCVYTLRSCSDDQYAQWTKFYTRMVNMQMLVDFFVCFLYVLFRVTV